MDQVFEIVDSSKVEFRDGVTAAVDDFFAFDLQAFYMFLI